MIVENSERKKERLKELHELLRKQTYPDEIIKKGIELAIKIPQETLRANKTNDTAEVLAFTTTHNPSNPDIFPMIKFSRNN